MKSDAHSFKIGDFDCMAVADGTHTYSPPTFPPPAVFLFRNAPEQQLREVLGEHGLQPENWTEWVSPYICLLVKTPEHRVLVDTGAIGLSPDTGKLARNLKEQGITPDDIDTVGTTGIHAFRDRVRPHSIGAIVEELGIHVLYSTEYFFFLILNPISETFKSI